MKKIRIRDYLQKQILIVNYKNKIMYALFANIQKKITKVITLLNGLKAERHLMIICKYYADHVILSNQRSTKKLKNLTHPASRRNLRPIVRNAA